MGEIKYIKNPEKELFNVAKNSFDNSSWRDFLFEIINKYNFDPWNLDISIFTKTYLHEITNLKKIDFNLSGKLLTISVYLLRLKTKELIEKDIKGIDEKIEEINRLDEENFEIDDLMEFDGKIEETKKEYKINFKNPFSRKKKVSIYDLIKTLENTLTSHRVRKQNFLDRANLKNLEYDGPKFEKKDLKQLLVELFDTIKNELSEKNSHINFSSLIKDEKTKLGILNKFIPLLHLHNQEKIFTKQNSHLDEIEIHKNQ